MVFWIFIGSNAVQEIEGSKNEVRRLRFEKIYKHVQQSEKVIGNKKGREKTNRGERKTEKGKCQSANFDVNMKTG